MAGSSTSGGPNYFDGVKIGKIQMRFLWVAAISYIFDQVDNGTFGFAAPSLIKNFKFTTTNIANINSMNLIGMFLGAIFGGWLSDKIGRKKGIMTTIILFSFGSILSGLGSTFPVIAAARFINGFGVVASVVIAMVYIAEMMPTDKRGKYQSLTIASATIGIPLMGTFAAWYIPQAVDNWRVIFYIGGGSIFLPILGYFWLKESPRWLVSKGRIAEAEKLVEEITGRKVDLSEEAKKITKKSSNKEALRIMLSKAYIKRTIVLVFLSLGINLGFFFLSGFYTTAMTKGGLPTSTVLTIMALVSWSFPIGDLMSAFVTDKGGRKMPIIIFCFIEGIAALAAGLTFIPVFIVISLAIQRIFGSGSNTMLWTYLSESYPTHIRSNAVGICFGLSRLVASVAQFGLPGLYDAYGWMGINMVCAAIVLTPAIIALIWGEKTSGKTLEELNPQAV